MNSRNLFAVLALLIMVSALAGCRESEQERPLAYEPGVYKGEADEQLDQRQLDQLRQRMQGQNYN